MSPPYVYKLAKAIHGRQLEARRPGRDLHASGIKCGTLTDVQALNTGARDFANHYIKLSYGADLERFNIRLICLIFWIIALSIIGRIFMLTSGGRSSGRGDSRGVLVLLGLGVFVLGLVGAFFGRLIMAAVSRQREYLADASAVQFTRNPDGIGGALKKIGGLAEGSRIDNPQAAEAGHMFFANAFAGEGLAGLLATHPPLVERIRRLDPQFDGQFREVRPVGVDREKLEGPRPGRVPPFAGMPRLPGLPQVPVPVLGFADEAACRVEHAGAADIC